MTRFQLKEANRYYWMVKGQLIPETWSEKEIMKIYDSYFSRLWGNNERAIYAATGFEAAWKQREAKNFQKKMK